MYYTSHLWLACMKGKKEPAKHCKGIDIQVSHSAGSVGAMFTKSLGQIALFAGSRNGAAGIGWNGRSYGGR